MSRWISDSTEAGSSAGAPPLPPFATSATAAEDTRLPSRTLSNAPSTVPSANIHRSQARVREAAAQPPKCSDAFTNERDPARECEALHSDLLARSNRTASSTVRY